jgi:5-formyltetrahydrofolate cyclo-ligase
VTSKGELRKEARVRRENLARAWPDFAQRIAGFADELPIAPGAVVAGYFPKNSEADPRALMMVLADRGHLLCLPAIVEGRSLEFRVWHDGDPTLRNAYGIEEPLASSPAVIPDVMLVPLLAFDNRGHRLGYGAGHYDRVLKSLRTSRRPLVIGVAHAEQEIAFVPDDSHDEPLDLLVCEKGLRRFDREP